MTIGQVVGIVGDASTYGIPCAERLYGTEVIGRVVEGAPGMPRYEDHGGNELGVIFDPPEQSCDGCLQPILDCSGPRREEEEDAFRNTEEHVKRDTSYTSVWWPNEEAFQPESDEHVRVSVFAWDYEKRKGKARTSDGRLVDVSMTNYALCDLTIQAAAKQK